ncbi:MAG TPA: hypothetical protein VFT13_14105, partial [Candidatus Krumholzibacteria bacterium]|nr:hypothetical protein [Candidatus Krumholzibacteria bacterium]
MSRRAFRRLVPLTITLSFALPAAAQEAPAPEARGDAPEEIIVTGSHIKGTPENAALNVDVTSLDDLKNVGAPTVVELVRNLSYTSGNLAETNQFQPGGQ